MNPTAKNPPAYPTAYTLGMTLRDAFAIAALQGLLSNSDIKDTVDNFAVGAYKLADAMLEARNGGSQ